MASAEYIEKFLGDFEFDDNELKSPLFNNYLSSSISNSVTNMNLLIDIEAKRKIWSEYPRIEQPVDLKIKLFPHQLVTVYKMEKFEETRRIDVNRDTYYTTDFGILGDIPGYGKSFSVVSLILRDKMQWDITQRQSELNINTINQCVKTYSRSAGKIRVRPNLILASSTLIEQWKEYFSHVKPDKLNILEISNKKDFDNLDTLQDVNKYDVIIVSSTRYNDLVGLFPNVVWKRFIFDEAFSTHIPSMRYINAGFVWFISATYYSIHVSSKNSYMGSFFKYFTYEHLKYFVIKNDIDFVKDSFKMPKIVEITHKCLNPRILNVLSSYIDNETKTMIGAGDIRSAIARLGGGSTNNSNLFEIVSKRQKEKLDQAKFSLEFWKGRNSTKDIETWEKRVKELEKNLEDLSEKYKTILEDDCSICYSTIEHPILVPCCQNVFCGKCMMSWLEKNKTCPMCRAIVNMKDIVYIDTNNSEKKEEKKEEKKDDSGKPKQKQEKVLELVKNGLLCKKKFLIFSSYDESFAIIRRELTANSMDFVEISGAKSTRDSKIKKFREGKVNVVFLNSKFNGAGINLEMATDVILYHEMPKDIREQVIGRALRIGREEDLTIHNLVF